ncbi:MAG: 4-hydroxy-3-methylbut-2-enyl diphosphate reductase [Candidatus Zixiibacteriota bacterium]|nr:MAG: 4-hydroxy-3-methylbut-2-enyl diphosphate reductase [candidate division Zixibacteria bacterium]
MATLNLYLAKARGFCMGVERSISMAEKAREEIEETITILNEIVHNNSVVADLENKGISRTTNLDDVKEGTLIIAAHGVAPSVIKKAKDKGLNVIDSTCPLVKVIHKAVDYFINRNFTVLVHGDPNHDEMKGVKGRNPEKIHVIKEITKPEDLPDIDGKVALISQSTQSLELFEKAAELIKQKYNDVKIKNTICDATRKHQAAIIELAPKVNLVLVVGSQTSANSKRLVSISKKTGAETFLIDSADELEPEWFSGIENIGITAGASTPDHIVKKVVERIIRIALKNGIKKVNIYDGKED